MTRLSGKSKHPVCMTVNGRAHEGYAEPRMLLADFLRHELGLYGTHVGCEHGVCGACTVVIDGVPSRSCTQYAVQADGASIETVESLADGGTLNALQAAFRNNHALQCGFCTSGILMSATAFLEETPAPTELQVREMLSGHICRCTGYDSIVRAILEAAGTQVEGEAA
jgi:2-furoyl-CoA dehydrogenase 2Fe-2S iron sulfur subunit